MSDTPSIFGGCTTDISDLLPLDLRVPLRYGGCGPPFDFDRFPPDVRDPFKGRLIKKPPSARKITAFFYVRIDWKETPEAHIFKADVPGFKKEEVKVEVEEGRVLQISGERSKEQEEKNEKYHLVERSSGKFLRRFWLPENAKMDQVKASMENGVLTVTVPKEEEVKKPEIKSVEISD